jgi:hypothetical protein
MVNKNIEDVCNTPNITTLSKLLPDELDIFIKVVKKL